MPELNDYTKRLFNHEFRDETGSEYEGTEFGGFGDYFANKMIKLQNQVQEALTHDESRENAPPIFRGCAIHINGYTKPPAAELKRLITLHGGIIISYLSGKTFATHIIASNLTSRKKIEYEKYKVIKPEWIVDCVKEQKLLPWSSYRTITLAQNQNAIVGTSKSNYNSAEVPDETSVVADDGGDEDMVSAMCDQISCLDPNFIGNFYKNSRLHHLSTWKNELKRKFQKQAKNHNSLFQGSVSKDDTRVIMHVDFDSFFVSVSLLSRPDLKEQPVCVGNSKEGNGDVASCNYIARKFGVRNGMWACDAKKLCPDLKVLPYDFKGYEKASTELYDVLSNIAPDVIFPVSVDEALIEVTSLIAKDNLYYNALKFASELRIKIRNASGIDASIGIGANVLLAKLALRKAKPSGEYYICDHDDKTVLSELGNLSIDDLPGMGYNIAQKLLESEFEVRTVNQLRQVSQNQLESLMGTKLGIKLYEYVRGIDYTDMTVIPSPKSIGVEIAWGVRVKDSGEMDRFVLNLTEELCKRMKEHEPELKGTQLVVKIYQRHRDAPVNPPKFMGSGYCYVFTKSSGLFNATNDLKDLAKVAKEITRNLGCPPQDLRGVGLQAVKLDNEAEEKISTSQTKLNFVPNIQSNLELKRKLVAPTTPTKKRARTESPQKQPGNSVLSLSLTPITRKAAKTLTQQFKLQRQRNRMAGSDTNAILQPAMKLPSDIDISVFQELPSQIREELLEDYRRRQPNNRNARNKAKTPRSPRPSTHLIFPSYRPIVFPDGHSTTVQQVRNHISAWINNGIELGYLPHYDDVNKIEKYLIDVSTHDKDWTKAVRLIEWMKRLVNGKYSSVDAEREWKFLIDMYAEVVRERLLARGLQVYEF